MATTVAQARARLTTFTAAGVDPTLTAAELDELVVLAKRADADGDAPDAHAEWQATTAYGVGAVVVPAARNGHYYRATVAGMSGAVEPAFPTTDGATVTDGTVTWQEAGLAPWSPTWDLNAAAAEGWRWKAAKVSARYDFDGDGQRFSRSQLLKHCLAMAGEYARKVVQSVPVNRYTVIGTSVVEA